MKVPRRYTMSSDSEEENGVRHEKDDSDGGNYDGRSRSHSRSASPGDQRSNRQNMSDREDSVEGRENGMRGESDTEENRGQKESSHSRTPEDKEMIEWSGEAGEKRCSRSRSDEAEDKVASRSRSKSKQREVDTSKERKSSSSSSKKKSRSRRSRSRSRSKKRSHSRSRRSRSRSRKKSRSRSRSRGSRRRSRSRSRRRSRSRSRSGTPVDGARLHVAELDVDTRKRDLERVFEKYGRLREIWMARNPPCFAFVVYAHQKDADRALKETDGIMIGHCRIKVTQARPRVRGGRMRGAYDPNLRCYQCGELGHFSRNCTDTKFGYKRPPTPPGAHRGSGRYRHRSRSRSRSRHHSRSRSRS
ncbi:serine/arginine-rich splicing factor 4-like isoform X1 [Penaeus monodon]|uniref:serine/arginine-rich splicing factor 4-like isoform X1 n=2 Tax=Penaeus monodon TaxID=6687 RepID=UPI0018A6D8DD|nr:serine/arginine-rich splicing factor 4-like isoform X1 [Penaeus monodon]